VSNADWYRAVPIGVTLDVGRRASRRDSPAALARDAFFGDAARYIAPNNSFVRVMS
jgi:hypothetical protein